MRSCFDERSPAEWLAVTVSLIVIAIILWMVYSG